MPRINMTVVFTLDVPDDAPVDDLCLDVPTDAVTVLDCNDKVWVEGAGLYEATAVAVVAPEDAS